MKELIISKELMSEVLNYEVDTFLGINKNEIDYTCCRDENEGYIDISINLYEFVFKCKEWANTQDYWTQSGYEIYHLGNYFCMIKDMPDNQFFYADTEPEAIFKACNWILENSK